MATLGLLLLSAALLSDAYGVQQSVVYDAQATQLPYRANDSAEGQHDHVYTFPASFGLEQPLEISVKRGQLLWMPIEAIRDKLVPKHTVQPAIALEVHVCRGRVQSSLVLKHRKLPFSSAANQCMTISLGRQSSSNTTLRDNLCPSVHLNHANVLDLDPALVQGFTFRADVADDAEFIALFRASALASTRLRRVFVEDDYNKQHQATEQGRVNITYADEMSEVSFLEPQILDLQSSIVPHVAMPCADCSYQLYVKWVDAQRALTRPPEPPLCTVRGSTISIALKPHVLQDTSLRAFVDNELSDQIVQSGLHRFAVLAMIPDASNYNHKLILHSYYPVHLDISAPARNRGHFFLALCVIGALGIALFIGLKRFSTSMTAKVEKTEENQHLLTPTDQSHIETSPAHIDMDEDHPVQVASTVLLERIKASKAATSAVSADESSKSEKTPSEYAEIN